jgi:hypothetical protein
MKIVLVREENILSVARGNSRITISRKSYSHRCVYNYFKTRLVYNELQLQLQLLLSKLMQFAFVYHQDQVKRVGFQNAWYGNLR